MAVSAGNYEVIRECDIIIIAVKPYQALEIMDMLHKMLRTSPQTVGSPASVPKSLRPLIISMAASVPLAEMEKRVCSQVLCFYDNCVL